MATLSEKILSTVSGKGSGFSNVVDTFKVMAANVVSGKILTPVPVAAKYENSTLAKASSIITAPSVTVALPAAVAAAPLLSAKVAAVGTAATAATSKALVGGTVLKTLGVGAVGGAILSQMVGNKAQTSPQEVRQDATQSTDTKASQDSRLMSYQDSRSYSRQTTNNTISGSPNARIGSYQGFEGQSTLNPSLTASQSTPSSLAQGLTATPSQEISSGQDWLILGAVALGAYFLMTKR